MAATRLKIYNGALRLCEERRLASLTENREPRRLLDEVWQDGGVRYCLEQAQWKFAMRASEFTYDTSVTTSFGYRYAFAKPTDWVATSGVCQDERFNTPLLQYRDETGYWFADLDTIYVRYVSDDENYGNNLAAWPESFNEVVQAHFAKKIAGKLSASDALRDTIAKEYQRALKVAKNKDAMADPTKIPPMGRWPGARVNRWGRGGPMGDGGNPGSLIG